MPLVLEPGMNSSDIVLSVNNIEVIYDHVILVLKGVSLEVPRGGVVALLGANGAGKTTTIKSISNILGTERGEVTKGSIARLHARKSTTTWNWFTAIFRVSRIGAGARPDTPRAANSRW